ncbi:Hypothetical predicted protein [Mytilus galloprovincialis]|uniref:Cadherin domain-containing protein n=1 Tax=Mytilus galloprovincialis TaxID=29158 RepID=A0A8B6D4E2_MYTGA|nr:Hypothetical predicted protein [Mytilus galloprovincialis]
MEAILKLGLVCTLLISLSQKGLSQNYPPRFGTVPSLLQFNEGCSNRTLVTISASGKNGVITISANDAATQAKVDITEISHTKLSDVFSTTVKITQKACMDRETEPTWYLQLLATDTSGLKMGELLQIYILDVNDEHPLFTSKLFQITEFENASLYTEVLKVEANDPDNGIGGVVKYSLVAQGQVSNNYSS